MSANDTIRTVAELAALLTAIFLMIYEPHIAAWERRAARKTLIWAVKHIPAFRSWLYGAPTYSQQVADEYKPRIEIRRDWRGRS